MGKFETPKIEGKYETGQLFLHRIFGYRGVTLFPWMAAVYDRDVSETNHSSKPDATHNPHNSSHHPNNRSGDHRRHVRTPPEDTTVNFVNSSDTNTAGGGNYSQVGREVKGQAHNYYQVLIDSRDCPHVVSIY